MLNKEDAQTIARKLQARIDEKKNRPHDLAKLYYEGKWIASFGISHGSNKDKGHDHIPKDLNASPRWCKELSSCHHDYAEWIQLMREKGLIDN